MPFSLISNLKGNFNIYKEDLIENFKKLKKKFVEIKSFKDKLLDLLENFVDLPTDGSKIFMAHVL